MPRTELYTIELTKFTDDEINTIEEVLFDRHPEYDNGWALCEAGPNLEIDRQFDSYEDAGWFTLSDAEVEELRQRLPKSITVEKNYIGAK